MGMPVLGIMEILIFLLVLGGGIFAFSRFGSGGSRSESRPQAASGTTLNCPFCNQETDAGRPACQHCGEDL